MLRLGSSFTQNLLPKSGDCLGFSWVFGVSVGFGGQISCKSQSNLTFASNSQVFVGIQAYSFLLVVKSHANRRVSLLYGLSHISKGIRSCWFAKVAKVISDIFFFFNNSNLYIYFHIINIDITTKLSHTTKGKNLIEPTNPNAVTLYRAEYTETSAGMKILAFSL